MPVINNGSQHDRIRKLQQRTIYAAYLTDKAAVDDKVLVQSSVNPQTSSNYTKMKEGAFIAKYDSLGVAQHAKSIGRAGEDLPLKIVLGSAGYIYISGYYSSTNTLS